VIYSHYCDFAWHRISTLYGVRRALYCGSAERTKIMHSSASGSFIAKIWPGYMYWFRRYLFYCEFCFSWPPTTKFNFFFFFFFCTFQKSLPFGHSSPGSHVEQGMRLSEGCISKILWQSTRLPNKSLDHKSSEPTLQGRPGALQEETHIVAVKIRNIFPCSAQAKYHMGKRRRQANSARWMGVRTPLYNVSDGSSDLLWSGKVANGESNSKAFCPVACQP